MEFIISNAGTFMRLVVFFLELQRLQKGLRARQPSLLFQEGKAIPRAKPAGFEESFRKAEKARPQR